MDLPDQAGSDMTAKEDRNRVPSRLAGVPARRTTPGRVDGGQNARRGANDRNKFGVVLEYWGTGMKPTD